MKIKINGAEMQIALSEITLEQGDIAAIAEMLADITEAESAIETKRMNEKAQRAADDIARYLREHPELR